MRDPAASHLSAVKSLVAEFSSVLSDAVDAVDSDVVGYLVRSVQQSDGEVRQSLHNSEVLTMLPSVFDQALGRSDYRPTVLAFVGTFKEQLWFFKTVYDQDSASLGGLPPLSMAQEAKQALVDHVASSVSALEAPSISAAASIRDLSARSLGGAQLSQLTQGCSEVVQKMKRVGPIAQDQVMIFLRILANSAYAAAESAGVRLRYSYEGPRDGANSEECASIPHGRLLSTAQVGSLSNRDGLPTMVNGGHVGCRHWFRAAGVRRTRTGGHLPGAGYLLPW